MIRRSTPIARSTTSIARSLLKRGTKRVAQMSDRALAQLPERARVVDDVWNRDRGQCRAEVIARNSRIDVDVPSVVTLALHDVKRIQCGGRFDPHEVIPRSAWPGGELCVDNVVIICRRHHEWVDANPTLAHAIGLHGYSWERP